MLQYTYDLFRIPSIRVLRYVVLATAVQPDGSGGEIKLLHCNGVKGAEGPNQHITLPGQPDLTDHGETGAIRAACSRMSLEELSTLSFYTSTEPCAMCSAAIFWAGCPKIVYGCPAPARGALATLPSYKESESPYCGNYGACSAPSDKGGRGVDVWRICDGIPNTAGVVREVVGPLLPEEGMDTHYYRQYWGIAKPGPEVECKWGAPAAAMATGAYNRRR